MSNNYNQISSFIWNVCDDVLRGLFKPHEYGDVILPFTVLRRLDCVLEPHKDDMFNIYEQYRKKVDDPTPIILNKINTTFLGFFVCGMMSRFGYERRKYGRFQRNFVSHLFRNLYCMLFVFCVETK